MGARDVTLPPTILLNELELDALAELAKIGVCRAAASLRPLVGGQVLLTVSSVAVTPLEEAVRILGERGDDDLVVVQQAFEGDISGRALLIFPETDSLELVRAVTQDGLPLEDILELEQEALAETGNIILNGCLATIADMLRCSLTMSLPDVLRGTMREFLALYHVVGNDDAVLLLPINAALKQHGMHGYIAMLMPLPALASLKLLMMALVERMAANQGAGNERRQNDTP